MTGKPEVPVLEGERVLLRPLQPEQDGAIWFKAMQEPLMHGWTGNTVPENIEEVVALLESYKTHKELIAWAVVEKPCGQMIGTYWIWIPVLMGGQWVIQAEAQRIARPYWRSGYTGEARRLVYEFAFNHLQADEIHAAAWEDNRNSCLSMEKAGYVLLESYAKLNPKYDQELTENHYVLTKEAWKERL